MKGGERRRWEVPRWEEGGEVEVGGANMAHSSTLLAVPPHPPVCSHGKPLAYVETQLWEQISCVIAAL